MEVLTIEPQRNIFRGEAQAGALMVGFEYGIGKFSERINAEQDSYGSFESVVHLEPKTTYLVRAFAFDKTQQIHYGQTVTFTTADDPDYGHAGEPYTGV